MAWNLFKVVKGVAPLKGIKKCQPSLIKNVKFVQS